MGQKFCRWGRNFPNVAKISIWDLFLHLQVKIYKKNSSIKAAIPPLDGCKVKNQSRKHTDVGFLFSSSVTVVSSAPYLLFFRKQRTKIKNINTLDNNKINLLFSIFFSLKIVILFLNIDLIFKQI